MELVSALVVQLLTLEDTLWVLGELQLVLEWQEEQSLVDLIKQKNLQDQAHYK